MTLFQRAQDHFLLVISVLALVVTLALVVGMTANCGTGKVACQVIDTAHEACAVIRYLGPDGKVRTVKVSNEEISAFGKRVATARAAAKKAEVEGGVE